MRLARSVAVLFVVGWALCLGAVGRADPTSPQIASARIRLDCLLHDRQQAREAIVAEQQRTQAHLAQIQAFRGRLSPSTNAEAIGVADQAIARDRSALSQLARRLALLDQAIATTRRAIANLVPAPPPLSLAEQARRAGNVSLANAMHCGRDPEASPVGDLSLWARLFAADLCGSRSDSAVESSLGLSRDPARIARLNRIVARLNMVSPNTSVRLLAGCPAIGGGAFATSTTSYIGECLLGADHSDAEVAFIVGHERGHVSMQHLSLTYIAQAWARLGLASQTTNSRVIDAALAANLGEFGREQEYEADLTGAVAALSAGFSPSGVDQALTSFGREPPGTGTAASRLQRMSADHPTAAQRRQALEAVLGDDFWDADPASGRCPRAAR